MDKAIKNVKKAIDKKMSHLVSMDKKLDKKCPPREKKSRKDKNGK